MVTVTVTVFVAFQKVVTFRLRLRLLCGYFVVTFWLLSSCFWGCSPSFFPSKQETEVDSDVEELLNAHSVDEDDED